MVDKDFCLSSYIAFRFIWKDDMEFFKGFKHRNYNLNSAERTIVNTAEEIDIALSAYFEKLYTTYNNIGILLSGGMDSAILASYLRPDSHAFTFVSDTGVFDADLERAQYYCKKYNLIHHLIPITFDDYKRYTPIVVANKYVPVHSIEPQIYKAAIKSKECGVETLITGESADSVFGGLDGLLSKDWTLDEFIDRYTFLKPELVLNKPVSQNEVFDKYVNSNGIIDINRFLENVFCRESGDSYFNAFQAAKTRYDVPYASLKLGKPLDIKRIRNGESKYLIRELFRIKFPNIPVPEKIPMPRPVDIFFKNWTGPTRPEFRKDIPMESLTGNQKWQLWCAELFLNMFDL